MSVSFRSAPQTPLSTWDKGQKAEELVAGHLAQQGWSILGRNIYTRFGEIDILAKEGREFVCVEVRSRTRKTSIPPEISVSLRKYQHLVRSLLSLAKLHNQPVRIDLVTVEEGSISNHFKDFQPNPS